MRKASRNSHIGLKEMIVSSTRRDALTAKTAISNPLPSMNSARDARPHHGKPAPLKHPSSASQLARSMSTRQLFQVPRFHDQCQRLLSCAIPEQHSELLCDSHTWYTAPHCAGISARQAGQTASTASLKPFFIEEIRAMAVISRCRLQSRCSLLGCCRLCTASGRNLQCTCWHPGTLDRFTLHSVRNIERLTALALELNWHQKTRPLGNRSQRIDSQSVDRCPVQAYADPALL